ncbi:hypothetical protein [Actinoplanes sp. M2I2]|uniref:hypothetical protein n=1 Tax=Actinoplanes sp. M2I2 TaxID=1734444 RepID=UPI00202033AD|nr:hypothetical protein [Actinoplanes sp. M2I2]
MTHHPRAGSETDQHVTGGPETGEFTTDTPPSADTPASGSSNAGINELRANRDEGEDKLPEPPD